jgi:hypothetical protein
LRILLALGLIGLSACGTVSLPATGVTNDGKNWTGYFTTKEFVLTDGAVKCTGTTPMGTAKQQTATFECDDGRTGTAVTNRTKLTGGTVNVSFSDGRTGSFNYGT